MLSHLFGAFFFLLIAVQDQSEAACLEREVNETSNFVGGGAGQGNATGSGSAAGLAGLPGIANITLGSLAAGSGGSYSDGSIPAVTQGSFSSGIGTVCGEANATGSNATAAIDAAGSGQSNGSQQSAIIGLIPQPPLPPPLG